MRNIFIIGNGFDLAHGLKTSYGDFLDDLKLKVCDRPTKYKNILNPDLFLQNNTPTAISKDFYKLLSNKFLRIVYDGKQNGNWSDLESLYFDLLCNCENKEKVLDNYNVYYDTVKELNHEFGLVKSYLASYLYDEQENFQFIEAYQAMFEAYDSDKTLIINFNYTYTVKKYLVKCPNIKVIHIHGELRKPFNPIIFGYAAFEDECQDLLGLNDSDFLMNIKSYNYPLSNNEKYLNNFLNSHENYVVNVFGHSCGISDKNILSQIFSNYNSKLIRIFHHRGYKGFKCSYINIKRILKKVSNDETKLSLFTESSPMLQFNSTDDDEIDFRYFLNIRE